MEALVLDFGDISKITCDYVRGLGGSELRPGEVSVQATEKSGEVSQEQQVQRP